MEDEPIANLAMIDLDDFLFVLHLFKICWGSLVASLMSFLFHCAEQETSELLTAFSFLDVPLKVNENYFAGCSDSTTFGFGQLTKKTLQKRC